MTVQGLHKLEVWKRSKDLALRIYREVFPLLPPEEKWNLNSQLRRSSLSISANIAEGYGRFYYQENIRFCYYARGSLAETLSHLQFAFDAHFIPQNLYKELSNEGDEIDRMVNGYISFLKQSKQGSNEPGSNLTIKEEPESYIADQLDNDRSLLSDLCSLRS